MRCASQTLVAPPRFQYLTIARPTQLVHAQTTCLKLIEPGSTCPTSRPCQCGKSLPTCARLHRCRKRDELRAVPAATLIRKSLTATALAPKRGPRSRLKSNRETDL